MLDLQLGMKSTKNILIATLVGLLALSLTSQSSQGADSPVTRAEFDALKAKLVTAQKNLDSLKSSAVSIDILTAEYTKRGGTSDFGCSKKQTQDTIPVGRFLFDVCRLKLLILP